MYPAWKPDGSGFAFSADYYGNEDIYFLTKTSGAYKKKGRLHPEVKVLKNPFTEKCILSFRLECPSRVFVSVLNPHALLIKTLFTNNLQPGVNIIEWDGKDMNGNQTLQGVYFIQINGDGFQETLKVVKN